MAKPSTEHSSFTLFGPKIDNAAFVADTDDPNFRDDLGKAYRRAAAERNDRIRFWQLEGGRPRDVNRSGLHVGAPIVSPRFIETVRERDLSGWTIYPIDLADKHGSSLDGFGLLGITGRCGPIQDDLSALVTVPPPVAGGRETRQLRGLFFEPKSWDGSDFCCSTDGSLHTFLSSAATQTLQEARLTGCNLRPAAELLRQWLAAGGFVKQAWEEP